MSTQAPRLLIAHADVVVTMDPGRREIQDGSVLVCGDAIEAVGTHAEIQSWIAADRPARDPQETIDARGCVVLPGLINCHHHLFQSLTRAVGTGRRLALFDWLRLLYPIWAELDPEAVYVSAKTALAELVRSGATTVADHLYLFPNGARLDDEIHAAREIGVRFHATRGCMSLGESRGGLPPDRIVEDEPAILSDCRRVIETFHDLAPRSMLRIGLAPCSPFSVTPELMRDAARLARSFRGVGLHTHLAETLDESRFCLDRFGLHPLDLADSVEWLGADCWFAHVVHVESSGIDRLAHARAGVCHCPSSNMILGSGIAPVRRMLDRQVNVALGVDGSASNDSGHLLAEARQAMLLQRVAPHEQEAASAGLSAREALELATLGGARVLGRDDIGSLETGKAADLVAFRVDDLEHAGAQSDLVSALITCAPAHAWLSVINGRIVVDHGALVTAELAPLIERHNQVSRRMLERAARA
ncbi:MAG TPA: 8-oxoguanine deaminase [Burkholderiales bacterium]|nr:8-oxoguanine deaminase [Burkholderiales bacterium]